MLAWGLFSVAVLLLLLGVSIIVSAIVSRLREQSMLERRFERVTSKVHNSAAWWLDDVVGRLSDTRFGSRLTLSDEESVSRMLWQAGLQTSLHRTAYYVLSNTLPFVLAGLAIAWLSISSEFDMQAFTQVMFMFLLGVFAPRRTLKYFASRRRRMIADEVPALVQVVRMLFESGLSMEQALRVIHDEGTRLMPNVCGELAALLQRIGAGQDQGEAMQEMADLLDVDELTDTVLILKQVLQQGGSAREPLQKLVDLISDRRQTRVQEKVNKMSANMSIVMMLFLFPALLVFLAAPGFIALIMALGGVTG